jgi:hypothetical protein
MSASVTLYKRKRVSYGRAVIAGLTVEMVNMYLFDFLFPSVVFRENLLQNVYGAAFLISPHLFTRRYCAVPAANVH